MNENWYPGIREFCEYWYHASTLQQTFDTLKKEFAADRDSTIDAAKSLVECACHVLIKELYKPSLSSPPMKPNIKLSELLKLITEKLKIDKSRDDPFVNLIKEHNKLANALRELRNQTGTVSHGKDGFAAKLSVHHRRAAVLAADAIVAFLHQAYLGKEPNLSHTLEPYERFDSFNDIIDKHTALDVNSIEDDSQGYVISVRVLLPNKDEISLDIKPSQLLFAIDREAYKQTLDACKRKG